MKKATSEFNGILLMNKPQGFTSHDVVAKLRGILRTRRIGHGGTLDPMATGVLPVFVGGATKAADFAAAQDKEYVAGFTLGYNTDTQDTTGEIRTLSGKYAAAAAVADKLRHFEGAQKQLPPMYSAVQVNGQRLYDLARKGIEIERQPRDIFIREIELLDFDEDAQTGHFRAVCSKGTYVRTIVNDLGETLGTLAAMHSLVRTRAGAYALEACFTFDEVQRAADEGRIGELLRPTDSLFLDYPAVTLDDYGMARAEHGAFMEPPHVAGMPQSENAFCRVYYRDIFLMLGQVRTLDKGGRALFVYKNFR